MDTHTIIKVEDIKQERVDYDAYQMNSTGTMNQFFKNETKIKIEDVKPKNGSFAQVTVKRRGCRVTICQFCQKKCYTIKKYKKHFDKFHALAHAEPNVKKSPKRHREEYTAALESLDPVKEEVKFVIPTILRTYSRKKSVVLTNEIKEEIKEGSDEPDLEMEWFQACLEHMK